MCGLKGLMNRAQSYINNKEELIAEANIQGAINPKKSKALEMDNNRCRDDGEWGPQSIISTYTSLNTPREKI